MEYKGNRPNFGGWHYNTYYIITGGNVVPAESDQAQATNRIIEASLAGMQEFTQVKNILDRIARM